MARSTNALWGDGFADDGWAKTMAVSRWDEVHPDEFIRLFPVLARHATPLPPVLLDHLAAAVAVQAARSRRQGAAAPRAAMADMPASARNAMWYAQPAPWRLWLERMGLGAVPEPVGADVATAFHLDALLAALRDGRPVAFSEALALTVAFHAALHPAYLWPEALAMADCATAAGWLGLVARGRPALMPLDVAGLIREAVELRAPRVGRLRDARLSLCGFGAAQWAGLAQAAHHRLAGRCVPVRLGAGLRQPPPRTVAVEAASIPARATPR